MTDLELVEYNAMAKEIEKRAAFIDAEKEFIKLFKSLCDTRSSWQVWTDLMGAFSCTIANVGNLDPDKGRIASREEEYESCIEHLGGVEVPSQIFAALTMALDKDSEQDFLGRMFMELELGSNWHGQFFTPFTVSQMMAQASIDPDKVRRQIEEKGWISVNDSSCGAGSTLIGAVAVLSRAGIRWQQHVAFVANDIDRIAAQMCYIQLSLLGCAGYVAVTNTLTNPITGSVLFPREKDGQEFYYTPMWWNDIWTHRRLFHMLGKGAHREKQDGKASNEEAELQMRPEPVEVKQNNSVPPEEKPEGSKENTNPEQISLFDFME